MKKTDRNNILDDQWWQLFAAPTAQLIKESCNDISLPEDGRYYDRLQDRIMKAVLESKGDESAGHSVGHSASSQRRSRREPPVQGSKLSSVTRR